MTQDAIEEILKMNPLCNIADPFTNCFLLDDGGYIISTASKFNNTSNTIGYFFGYVERDAMELLANKTVGVFGR